MLSQSNLFKQRKDKGIIICLMLEGKRVLTENGRGRIGSRNVNLELNHIYVTCNIELILLVTTE